MVQIKAPTIVKTLVAQREEEVRPGVFVYDMGQNMVGFPRISLPDGQAGDTVLFRYAEVKYPDLDEYGNNVGMIMMENIRAALTHDYYIRKGGSETFRPRFTFHGYRFLEISGLDQTLPKEAVEGLVISSVHQLASHYETSNPLVNQLWENITWSLRGNFLSIPTDTPGRHEMAYRLLQQTTYPSWLYSVVNGATTIWERLNSFTVEEGFGGNNSMNSFNHYSFGAVGAWKYNYSLGIQRHPTISGFKQFVLKPQPDPDKVMTWAKGHYDSMYGRIESEWSWGEGHWNYKATVPPNTSAILLLPASYPQGITEGGKALKEVKDIEMIQIEGNSLYLKLNSGIYDFKIGQLP